MRRCFVNFSSDDASETAAAARIVADGRRAAGSRRDRRLRRGSGQRDAEDARQQSNLELKCAALDAASLEVLCQRHRKESAQTR